MALNAATKRKAGFAILALVFGILQVFLLACLALGVAFAVTGSFSNCHGSVSQCEQVQEANKHTSYGLMIAATIAAVLFFPPLATLFVYALIEILTGRAGEDQPDTNTCELQATNCNQLQTEEPDGQNDDGCIEFPDHKAVNFDIKKLRSLSVPAAVMLGLTFLCFTISLVGFLWMVVLAYDNPTKLATEAWPFIITEFIAGLVCPCLAVIGCGLGAIVCTFLTDEEGVDLRVIIHRLLPAVMLKRDVNSGYHWEIINHFYITLKKKSWGSKGDLRYAVSRNLSTWLLVCISGLAVILATSSYINGSFVESTTVPSIEFLEESDICINYACFGPVTFNRITANCSELNPDDLADYEFVHCFRFITFGSGILTNIAVSIAFYLATVHSIQVIFFITLILQASKCIKAWGGFMVFAGVVVFIGALAYIFSPHFVNIRLDVIVGGQITLIATYLALIGILLCTGTVRPIKN